MPPPVVSRLTTRVAGFFVAAVGVAGGRHEPFGPAMVLRRACRPASHKPCVMGPSSR